jgi:eukaryotic-like serine/threonine-protein kinase
VAEDDDLRDEGRPDTAPDAPAVDGTNDGASSGARAALLRRRRSRSPLGKLLLYGLLLAVSFVIGIQLFNLVIMPAFVGHRKEVSVPDLAGKEIGAAEVLLSRVGLLLGDVQRRNDPRATGTILAQHPAAGLSVKTGRAVAVVVSLGEAASAVPALQGQSQRNARMALESAGLSPGEIDAISSETISSDAVVATEPAVGAPAPRGAAIAMLVSTGGTAAAWMMPDLKGMDAAEVERRLTEAGFTVETEQRGGVGRGRHRIVDTQPAPGARVLAGDRIVLVTN